MSPARRAARCAGKLTRPNTSFGSITYTLNAARQNYNALILAVKGRFARRGFLTASYTRFRATMIMRTTIRRPDWDRYYGPSIYDVPSRLTLGATYQIPGVHNGHGLLGRF